MTMQKKTLPIGKRCASSPFSLPGRLSSGASRTGDSFQNGRDDSLLSYPMTMLRLLGLRYRRYSALSAWQSSKALRRRGFLWSDRGQWSLLLALVAAEGDLRDRAAPCGERPDSWDVWASHARTDALSRENSERRGA
jgi:hypothetical protein